jgi:hypothetical protein
VDEGQLREGGLDFGGWGISPLPTITSILTPLLSFHITCRMAVSDTDMGKRHAAGVTSGCVCPGAALSGGRAIEGVGIRFWMRGS